MPSIDQNILTAAKIVSKAGADYGSVHACPGAARAAQGFSEWLEQLEPRLPRDYVVATQHAWGATSALMGQISVELLDLALVHQRNEPYQWTNPHHTNRDHVLHAVIDAAGSFKLYEDWLYMRSLVLGGRECALLSAHSVRYFGEVLDGAELERAVGLAYLIAGLLHDTGYMTYGARQLARELPFPGFRLDVTQDVARDVLADSLIADLIDTHGHSLWQTWRDGDQRAWLLEQDWLWAAVLIRVTACRLRRLGHRDTGLRAALELASAIVFFHDLGWEKDADKQRGFAQAVCRASRFARMPACALFMLVDMTQIGGRPLLVGQPGCTMKLSSFGARWRTSDKGKAAPRLIVDVCTDKSTWVNCNNWNGLPPAEAKKLQDDWKKARRAFKKQEAWALGLVWKC